MAQKRKETPKVVDWTTLKGKWFHTFDDEGYVKYQGQILDFVNQEIAVIQLYEWVAGTANTVKIVWLRDIVDGGWALYPSDEDMNYAYEYLIKKRK